MSTPTQLADLQDWAPANGSWDVQEGSATYRGMVGDGDNAGLLLAPDTFRITRGSITAKVHLDHDAFDSQARIVFGRNPDTGAYMAVGLGGHNARFVIEEWEPDHQALRRIKVGSPPPLNWPPHQTLTVHIKERQASLMVNGATVLRAVLPRRLRTIEQIGLSAWGPTHVAFDSIAIEREDPMIFAVMQFDGYEQVYSEMIDPLENALDVDVKRVDEILHPGSIISDIERGIAEADLVVAEITENNANVFYEAGYASALGKPVLLLAKRGRPLPFDLLGERCFFYQDTQEGRRLAAEELQRRVKDTLARIDPPPA